MNEKTVSESESEMSRLVLPEDTNSFGNLYGGRLVEWMDNIASITAFKHARSKVVTGSIDSLFFLSPVKLGYIVNIHSRITYVTRSTMEVEITVKSENVETAENKITTRAYFTYVAIDDSGHSIEIPGLKIQGPDEERRYHEGELRNKMRIELLEEARKI
ncbi:acyl-CoA thioesterase [Acidiplasma cupricumulans]|uniref:acyl-CoA thioesterase n=1 Tax=Acidiplasma cupricumulans TaxID=312540 RepID=UPI000784C0EB|nr:acyl-CoA thioesterase [Acidiplasma cupricumulans]